MRKRALIKSSGPWRDGKDAGTYAEAARTAEAAPPDLLYALLENVRLLAPD